MQIQRESVREGSSRVGAPDAESEFVQTLQAPPDAQSQGGLSRLCRSSI